MALINESKKHPGISFTLTGKKFNLRFSRHLSAEISEDQRFKNQSKIMYVLITYDVSTTTPAGRKRLRHVAKTCLDYGQRVQNSVFECKVDPGQFVQFKHRLCQIVDPETDSLRFYQLGVDWHRRVEHFGAKAAYDIEGFLGV